jgi:hypothetical protein
MRARTIFGILLVLVALVAFGPALVAVGASRWPKPSAVRSISTG